MTREQQLNGKIVALWKEFFSQDDTAKFPLFFPTLEKECLLFVGCNPSFTERGFRKILRGTEHEQMNVPSFYSWRNQNSESMEKAAGIEIHAKLKHDYFKKFREISKELGLAWEHIDLFFIRETNQKFLVKQLHDGKALNGFAQRQLDIAKELISLANPKVIVVANAFASRVFQDSYQCSFDDSRGCHLIKLDDKTVPVFFSSMFTGQRALDNGSFARLKWHIKKITSESFPP